MPIWSHLIRFKSGKHVFYGDAVFPHGADPTDVVSIAQEGGLQAVVISGDGDPVSIASSAKRTGTVLPVEQLLSPLTKEQVPIIRCIGLNYMKHSTFIAVAYFSCRDRLLGSHVQERCRG